MEQYDSQRLCKNTSILAQGMLRIEGQRKLRLYAGVYSAVEIGWNAVGWLVFCFCFLKGHGFQCVWVASV